MFNVQTVKSFLLSKKASGIILKRPSSIFYITLFSGEGYAYVSDAGQVTLYVDGRYSERARYECRPGVRVVEIKEIFRDISSDIRKGLPSPASVMFEPGYFSCDEHAAFRRELKGGARLVSGTAFLSKIRSVKDKDELGKIEAAVAIAESSMLAALGTFVGSPEFMRPDRFVHPDSYGLRSPSIPSIQNSSHGKEKSGVAFGKSCSERDVLAGRHEEEPYRPAEADLAAEYKMNLLRFRSQESFDTIILSGKRSSVPHGVPSAEVEIDRNGVLLCDFGAEIHGYKSDETLTVHLGKPDKLFRDVYDTVYSAGQYAISAIKPGIKFNTLDAAARDYIDKKGYGKYFTHSLGHGVGLEIHEYPAVSKKNNDAIEEGMVFTIEPGVYMEGKFGVRIEDMCYVEKDGARVITRIKKNKCNIDDLLLV